MLPLPLCCTSRPLTIFSMLFNSDGELLRFKSDGGVVGDIEIGLVGGEFDEARGRGLELRLRGPLSMLPALLPMPGPSEPLPLMQRLAFDWPGVTASKAEPKLPGRLYGEKRWPFRPCSGETGVCPE